uniref:Phosphorylated adapter RNA export protein n=1 Tax=Cercocebus atys TaxID=9531 RepID=A0A2K5L974_CERAT
MALEVGDMEDGQLSHSDSDMTVAPSDTPLQLAKVLGGHSAMRQLHVSHYRAVESVDSSKESFSDSDDDSCLWKRKRQKCFNPPPKPEPFLFGQSSQKPPVAGGKKINNIRGAVLQEQNQDAVATELGILGMEGTIDRSRQSETCDYLLAKKLRRESQKHIKGLDKELDEYMHGGKKKGIKGRGKRARLGNRPEMNYKGRYEITEEDSQEKVADEISFRLQEPKKDLIARVVRITGNKKAIELLMENSARKRRTQVLGKKIKQAIKSLNFQEDDDTSQETFASDTNEALASLDESQEGHGEAKLDSEEAIEVDHSQDLDTF